MSQSTTTTSEATTITQSTMSSEPTTSESTTTSHSTTTTSESTITSQSTTTTQPTTTTQSTTTTSESTTTTSELTTITSQASTTTSSTETSSMTTTTSSSAPATTSIAGYCNDATFQFTEGGSDYYSCPNKEVQGRDFQQYTGNSFQDCANYCNTFPACKGWTIASGSSAFTCDLKAATDDTFQSDSIGTDLWFKPPAPPGPNDCSTQSDPFTLSDPLGGSSTQFHPYCTESVRGATLINQGNANDYLSCADGCSSDPSCSAFIFTPSNSGCYTYSGAIVNQGPSNNEQSGVRI